MLRSRLHAGALPERIRDRAAEGRRERGRGAHREPDPRHATSRDSVAALEAGAAIGEQEIAQNRLMASYMMRLRAAGGRAAVHDLSGSHWIFNSHPMQVILRDALAGATHRGFNWEINARDLQPEHRRLRAAPRRRSGRSGSNRPVDQKIRGGKRHELPRSQRNPRRHADRLGHADQDGRRPGAALRHLPAGQAGQISGAS